MIKNIPKFKCPACNKYTIARVMDSRIGAGGVIRRRICEWCGVTFITTEKMTRITKNHQLEVRG